VFEHRFHLHMQKINLEFKIKNSFQLKLSYISIIFSY
jgi:hypothetical protein